MSLHTFPLANRSSCRSRALWILSSSKPQLFWDVYKGLKVYNWSSCRTTNFCPFY